MGSNSIYLHEYVRKYVTVNIVVRVIGFYEVLSRILVLISDYATTCAIVRLRTITIERTNHRLKYIYRLIEIEKCLFVDNYIFL